MNDDDNGTSNLLYLNVKQIYDTFNIYKLTFFPDSKVNAF